MTLRTPMTLQIILCRMTMIGAFLLGFAIIAHAQTPMLNQQLSAAAAAAAQAERQTQIFVTLASLTDRFEIEAGQLALERAKDTAVRQFAQSMIDEHTKAGAKLKAALAAAGMQPSQDSSRAGLDTSRRETLEALRQEQGAAFDKAYMAAQLEEHREALDLYGDYAQTGAIPSLKTMAEEALPMIERHLQQAEQLAVKLKG